MEIYRDDYIQIVLNDNNEIMCLCEKEMISSTGVPFNSLLSGHFQKKLCVHPCIEPYGSMTSICLYSSFRNIRKSENSNAYIESEPLILDCIVFFNREKLPHNLLYRSLGHVNDIHEIEIHEVLVGTIIEIYINPNADIFYGLYSKGDMFYVPSGWFHCTYVLSQVATISNIYSKTFWRNNIAKKPYFGMYNPLSMRWLSNDKIEIYNDNKKTTKETDSFTIKNAMQQLNISELDCSLVVNEMMRNASPSYLFGKTDYQELINNMLNKERRCGL